MPSTSSRSLTSRAAGCATTPHTAGFGRTISFLLGSSFLLQTTSRPRAQNSRPFFARPGTLVLMRVIASLFIIAACVFATPEDDVRRVLDAQVAAWNRGDIPGFMRTYAPDTVFVGSEVTHGAQ